MTDERRLARRQFLGIAAAGVLTPLGVSRLAAQSGASRSGDSARTAAELRDPAAAGRARARTAPGDNDDAIREIELGLACSCGCTLDIYTCRTTDFTCTVSPALHREILALDEQGLTAEQIVDAFVAKYGEQALMAPEPSGFNLAGYLVPGAAIAVGGSLLAWIIARRQELAPAAAGGEPMSAPHPGGTPEELARLQRALDEVDD